jgi:KaiC/GvpD/RAD55 family RecA-like ATPase
MGRSRRSEYPSLGPDGTAVVVKAIRGTISLPSRPSCEQVLSSYTELFERTFAHLSVMVGAKAAQAIAQRAIKRAKVDEPALGGAAVSEDRVVLDGVRKGSSTAVELSAVQATTVLVGEYEPKDVAEQSEFVEQQLVDLQARVIGGKTKRAVIDSLTMLFHSVVNADVVREHGYDITTLFKSAGCTALLHTDPPAGSGLISRFGVEEFIMDGVIVLRLTRERGRRRRTIEVYKMRGVNHASGDNPMKITSRGMFVFPRMEEVPE